jgi:hypothetical protein
MRYAARGRLFALLTLLPQWLARPAPAAPEPGCPASVNPDVAPLRRRANGARTAVVSVPAGSTVHFRYLAEGGIWFDDETASAATPRGHA